MTVTRTSPERITALEVKVLNLEKMMQSHIDDTTKRHDSITGKLDDLLGLRNKGVGAFWLASALAGTGIVSLFFSIIDWFKHG